MPIYEYKCPKCDNICEVIQKFSDDVPKCDKCDITMEKKFNNKGGTFILKGSCWAEDGYTRNKVNGK